MLARTIERIRLQGYRALIPLTWSGVKGSGLVLRDPVLLRQVKTAGTAFFEPFTTGSAPMRDPPAYRVLLWPILFPDNGQCGNTR